MILRVELKPETESRIAEQASSQGVSVEEYVQRVLESIISSPLPTTLQERKERFEDWLKSHSHITAPPLSDEAISRESIYGEREDRRLWNEEVVNDVNVEQKVSKGLQRMMAGKKTEAESRSSSVSRPVVVTMAEWVEKRPKQEEQNNATAKTLINRGELNGTFIR